MPDLAKLKKKAADLEQKRQFDRALAVYEEILVAQEGSDEADVSLLNRVGDLRQRLGRYPEAAAAYERAVELYIERGFLNNAIALCNKILRQDPTRAEVHYRLGRMSAEKGFRSDAKRHFLEYAGLMQTAGRLDEAFTALNEFAELSPEHSDVRLVLAEQLAKHGRTDEAIAQLTTLLSRYEAERRHADADAVAERIRALDPSFAAPPHSEGEIDGSADGDVHVGAPFGSRLSTPPRPSNGMPELVLIDPTEYGAGESEPPRRPSLEMPDTLIRGDALELPTAEPRRSSEFERGRAAARDDLLPVDETADVADDFDFDDLTARVDGLTTDDADAPRGVSALDGFEATEFDPSALGPSALEPSEFASTEFESAEFDMGGLVESEIAPLELDGAIPGLPDAREADAVDAGHPTDGVELLIDPTGGMFGDTGTPESVGYDELELEGPSLLDPASGAEEAEGSDLPSPFGAWEQEGSAVVMSLDDLSASGDLDGGAADAPVDEALAAAADDELLAFSLQLDGRADDVDSIGGEPADAGAEPHPAAESVGNAAPELVSWVEAEPEEAGEEVTAGAGWRARLAGARALVATGDRNMALRELAAALEELDVEGRRDIATGVLDEMIALDPTSISLHQQRVERATADGDGERLIEAHRALAVALADAGQPERARAEYERLLAISPSDGEARAALASLRPRGTTEPRPPVIAGREATPGTQHGSEGAGSPAGAGDFVNLGDLLRSEEAPRTTRMVVEEKAPSGDEQADFAEMLRKFKQGVAENVDDGDYESHYDLGVAYKEMGLLDEAVAAFQRALRGTAHRARTYEALGQCFLEREQYAVASAVLQRALGEPGADDHQLVGVLYLLGRAAEAMNQRNEALSYYQRVFAVDIEFADVTRRMDMADRVTR